MVVMEEYEEISRTGANLALIISFIIKNAWSVNLIGIEAEILQSPIQKRSYISKLPLPVEGSVLKVYQIEIFVSEA